MLLKRYDNIQILRVLACLGVFVTHLAQRMGITGFWGRAANFGASGVYLFFLISAFLACGSAGCRPGAGRKGVISYYIRRAFRILPLYYAVILYNFLLHTLLLHNTTPDPAGLGWLRYLFMTNAFFPAPDNFWGNLSGTWTISLFVCFYLTAPLLVRAAGVKGAESRKNVGSRKDVKRGKDAENRMDAKGTGSRVPGSFRISIGVVRAAVLYAATLLLQQIWLRQSFSDYMMFFYYLHFFALGILVWQLAACCRPVPAALCLCVILLPTSLLLYALSGGILYFTALSWIFALLLLLTLDFSWERLRMHTEHRAVLRAVRICEKGFGILDMHSFGIYLVHGVVMDGMIMLQGRMEFSAFAVFLIVTGATAAGAFLAHRLIELPGEKLGRFLAGRISR